MSDGDLLIRLISDDIGSITVGASVYFRKVPVGNIADYRFTKDQKKSKLMSSLIKYSFSKKEPILEY